MTPSNCSDVEQESQESQAQESQEQESQEQESQEQESQEQESTLRFWDKSEETSRLGIDNTWKEMINGTCHRRVFLSYLNEDKVQPIPIPTPRETCCSRYNPSLYPQLTVPPKETPGLRMPTRDTRAGIALEMLQD
ncbi:hypothetical protein EG327_006654 [Venturia inaequalis]|uniref:Uncharacterized protein n=1 Tax=Venturia inaequalis TaxID=5025 RepID=A0A8H3UZK4_VENIN|nr:hypothetical protein EG327_006654 [Venturia inaequalis]